MVTSCDYPERGEKLKVGKDEACRLILFPGNGAAVNRHSALLPRLKSPDSKVTCITFA